MADILDVRPERGREECAARISRDSERRTSMEWEDVKELAVILLEVMIAAGAMILFPSAVILLLG